MSHDLEHALVKAAFAERGATHAVLHATAQGKPLYADPGWSGTNEMARFLCDTPSCSVIDSRNNRKNQTNSLLHPRAAPEWSPRPMGADHLPAHEWTPCTAPAAAGAPGRP